MAVLPPGCLSLAEVVLFANMCAISIGLLASPLVLIERFDSVYNYTSTNAATDPCGNSSSNSTGNSSAIYYVAGSQLPSNDMDAFIEAKVSQWSWYLTLICLLPAIPLTALLFGPWSDVVGRRVIILFGLVGNLSAYAGLLAFHWLNLPFYFLIIAYAVQGVTGGQAAVVGLTFAYISDVSTKEERTARLTVVEATVFLGSGVGSGIGSVMTEHLDAGWAIVVMVSISISQIIYVIFILQEGKYWKATQQAATPSANDPIAFRIRRHLRRIHHVYIRPSKYRLHLWLTLGLFCFLMIVYLGSGTADVLFARLRPFCLSEQNVGFLSIAKSGLSALYAFIVAPVAKKMGFSDISLALFGILCFFLSKIMYGFAMDVGFLFAAAAVAMPMVIVAAVVRSMMSKMVEMSYQGTLFSVVAGLEALAAAVGTVLYNLGFQKFLGDETFSFLKQPAGFMYIATALLILPCPFVLLYVHVQRRGRQSKGYEELPGSDAHTAVQAPDKA